jgi:hypothetical protein
MRKTSGGANATVIRRKASEVSPNQGFLTALENKASHGLQVEQPVKSRKGLKSGEPFYYFKLINLLTKKGRI